MFKLFIVPFYVGRRNFDGLAAYCMNNATTLIYGGIFLILS